MHFKMIYRSVQRCWTHYQHGDGRFGGRVTEKYIRNNSLTQSDRRADSYSYSYFGNKKQNKPTTNMNDRLYDDGDGELWNPVWTQCRLLVLQLCIALCTKQIKVPKWRFLNPIKIIDWNILSIDDTVWIWW